MKDKFSVRVSQDGSVEGIYQDGLADSVGAKVDTVKRASHVEFEKRPNGEEGWTVRSAIVPGRAIRIVIHGGRFAQVVSSADDRNAPVAVFKTREDALEAEVRFFWDLAKDAP